MLVVMGCVFSRIYRCLEKSTVPFTDHVRGVLASVYKQAECARSRILGTIVSHPSSSECAVACRIVHGPCGWPSLCWAVSQPGVFAAFDSTCWR